MWGAMESVGEVITMVQQLLDAGAAYVVDDPDYPDIYASITATDRFGYESNYSRGRMLELFAERGGDPDRPGKRDPLDALLWRVAREGEPAWDAPFGAAGPAGMWNAPPSPPTGWVVVSPSRVGDRT